MGDEGITTYCIEYAVLNKANCVACNKVIPRHALRAGEIFRKSKSEKKKSAKHSWYHFRCWKVPELVAKLPIEQFRGYPSLKEKDQNRVKRVIEKGVGATWSDVSEKPLPRKDEQDEAEKTTTTMTTTEDKPKKRKRETDMTARLTGVQKQKKVKTKVVEEEPKITLEKEDQLELESIAKEIRAFAKKH
ncbi:hypothetical protein BJV82DRAFT_645424 [Fennellomyces sp. T-0311]|nr:hypothetical protein BJV82DRAFT_645424 [Fennellomyces sp. T-0311]